MERQGRTATLLGGASLLVAAAVVAVFAIWGVGRVAEGERSQSPPAELPPAPRIQKEPRRQLEEYLRGQRELLESYGWVNREAEVVRLPVTRAADILLAREFPVRAPPAAGEKEGD